MTNQNADRPRPDGLFERDPSDRGARRPSAPPRWPKLGLAAALGVVAGTMLFATKAEGEVRGRKPRRRSN